MIASIQEMSSTNTQQLRVSSRTRRSWQRRGLAVLVVSAYLLQCATADIFGMAVAYAMPKVINFAMRNLPQCKSWLSKKLGTPCQRCNPKNLAPGDELADYLTERGIVLRESLPNHPDTCKRQLDDTPDPHQTKEACDASDDCQWMEFTSCDKCGGDGFVHVSDRVEGIGNYMPSDEDLQKAVQEGDYGNLLGKFKDGALAFLPAAQSYYAELANNGCPNCVCKSSKKPRKDCTDWHPTSAGKCKTDPCSNCKRMRNRRLMARLQGSSKTASHGRRLCEHTWFGGDCGKCKSKWDQMIKKTCEEEGKKYIKYDEPSILQNLKNQALFQLDFTWNTRLSNANIKHMISFPDGLATYACDTIIHNFCKVTDLETDDVKDLFIGIGRGDPRMILENICDICVDKVHDIMGLEVENCISLFKNICLRRWEEARQDIRKIGSDVVCKKCKLDDDELKEFLQDPTALTAVNICAGIMKSQIEIVCPFVKFLPGFDIEFRRRLTQLEPAVASTTTDSKLTH